MVFEFIIMILPGKIGKLIGNYSVAIYIAMNTHIRHEGLSIPKGQTMSLPGECYTQVICNEDLSWEGERDIFLHLIRPQTSVRMLNNSFISFLTAAQP